MTDDQASGRDSGSGRLWTEPRADEEHTQWLATPTAVRPPPERAPAPTEPDPRRPVVLYVAIGLLLASVLVGGGVLGSSLLRDDGSAAPVAALPAAPGAAAPDARSRTIRQIYASASPSVVFIKSQEGRSTASGSGFVIDSDGTIVTNAHVVEGATDVQVRFDDKGTVVNADVLGSDASSDLAVLRVDPSHTKNLTPLAFADSSRVRVGDLAIAIGYPLGLDETLTQGVVSGIGRAIDAPNGFSIDKVIQTDAPINPGNSGGPLLDAAGRVIGVNAQIASTTGASIGIGYAVPSNTARQVVPRLRSGATITRAYLGISTSTSTGVQGAQVGAVVSGGPAERDGIEVGDTIVSIAGRAIRDNDAVSAAIADRAPGDRIDIELLRAGSNRTVSVTLGTRPESASGLLAPQGAGP